MQTASRREFLRLAATAAALSTTSLGAMADDRVIKVGTLKLIHGITPYFYEKFVPAGIKVQVYPFETPTDGKNAVVTRSVDFGTYGLAAATLGGAAGEPVVVTRRSATAAWRSSPGSILTIKSIKDLKGKSAAL